MSNKNKKIIGFSLIELMVVLSIVSIVVGLAIPKFKDMQSNAYNMQAMQVRRVMLSNYISLKDELLETTDFSNGHIVWLRAGNDDETIINGGEIWKNFYPNIPKNIYAYVNLNTFCVNNQCGYINVGHCKSTPDNNPNMKYNYTTFDNLFEVATEGWHLISKASRRCPGYGGY